MYMHIYVYAYVYLLASRIPPCQIEAVMFCGYVGGLNGVLVGTLGAPGGTLGSLGGRFGILGELCGPIQPFLAGVETNKKQFPVIIFSTVGGPGCALQGPLEVALGLGAPPRPSGRLSGDHSGIFEKSEASKPGSLEGL